MMLPFVTGRSSARARRGRERAVFGIRMSWAGVVFCLGTGLMGIAAMDADINLLLAVFGMCLGCILINAFCGWRSLRSLRVRRIVPESVFAGRAFVIRYVVTNERRWGPARCIRIADKFDAATIALPSAPGGFIVHLAAGETATLNVPTVSPARGRLRFKEIQLSTRFPFFLFRKWARHRCEDEIVVYPALGKWIADWDASMRVGEAAESGSAGLIKGDDEVYGLREYRAGDNPRRIHWRRSARTGQLMIREMVRTETRNIWCVVNTQIAAGNAAQARNLELAICAAATFICAALERGARVGLVCNGAPPIILPPASGKAARPRLLRELAIRTQNSTDPLAEHVRRMTWPPRWRGRCRLFAAAESEDLRAAMRALSRAVGPASPCVPGTNAFSDSFAASEALEPASLSSRGASSALRQKTKEKLRS